MNTDTTRIKVLVGKIQSKSGVCTCSTPSTSTLCCYFPHVRRTDGKSNKPSCRVRRSFFCFVKKKNFFMQGFLSRSTREYLHSFMTILLQPDGLMPIVTNLELVLINRCQKTTSLNDYIYNGRIE